MMALSLDIELDPLSSGVDDNKLRRGASKKGKRPKRKKLKEALSQLSCLFCIVGGNRKKESEDHVTDLNGKIPKTLSPRKNGGPMLSDASNDHTYRQSLPSDGSPSFRGDRSIEVSSAQHVLALFGDLPIESPPSRKIGSLAASSITDDLSPRGVEELDIADPRIDEQRGIEVLSAPMKLGEVSPSSSPSRSKGSSSPFMRKLMKLSKSVNGADDLEENRNKKSFPTNIDRTQALPTIIFDEISEIGDLHPEDLRQVNGVVWMQNPDPTNAGYYSGPALFCTMPHGKGRMLFANGDSYEGMFQNGKMEGIDCTYVMQNGCIYKGNFHHNLRHGHGETRVGDMLRYVGGYHQGVPHGYGEAFNVDGTVFHKGQFENGMPAHTYHPYITNGDEVSMASELIPMACDISHASTTGPRVSRYDENRAVLLSGDDDSSADGSCFSDLTDMPDLPFSASGDTSLLGPRVEESIYAMEPSLTAESLQKHTVDARRYGLRNQQINAAFLGPAMNPSSLYGCRVEL